MKILLDTHFLLWILFDSSKLTNNDLEIIKDTDNSLVFRATSFLEISLKYSINKLKLEGVTAEKLPRIVEKAGFIIEQPSLTIFSWFYKLPNLDHRDAFDRLLIWEAIQKNYIFMTRDKRISIYKKQGLKII